MAGFLNIKSSALKAPYVLLPMLALTVWAFDQTAFHLFEIMWRDERFLHSLMALPVVAILLVTLYKESLWQQARFDGLGLLALGASILMALTASLAEIWVLRHFSLLIACHACLLFTVGRGAYTQMRFPALFSLFAIPVGESAIPVMQKLTATGVMAVVQLFGGRPTESAFIINYNGYGFHVAEACSGFKFLLVSFFVSVLLAFLNFRRWHSRAAFIVLGLLLPVLGNGIRVLVIIFAAGNGHQEAVRGLAHSLYGWGIFAAVSVILYWVAYRFGTAQNPILLVSDAPKTPLFKAGLYSGLYAVLLVSSAFLFSGSEQRPVCPYLKSEIVGCTSCRYREITGRWAMQDRAAVDDINSLVMRSGSRRIFFVARDFSAAGQGSLTSAVPNPSTFVGQVIDQEKQQIMVDGTHYEIILYHGVQGDIALLRWTHRPSGIAGTRLDRSADRLLSALSSDRRGYEAFLMIEWDPAQSTIQATIKDLFGAMNWPGALIEDIQSCVE